MAEKPARLKELAAKRNSDRTHYEARLILHGWISVGEEHMRRKIDGEKERMDFCEMLKRNGIESACDGNTIFVTRMALKVFEDGVADKTRLGLE